MVAIPAPNSQLPHHIAYILTRNHHSSDSPAFSSFKKNKELSAALHTDAPSTQIHAALAPHDGDMVHRKTRFGAFMRAPSRALLDDLVARGIDTVVVGGVITSGAVLSAVRQLGDLDFRLLVLEDCCADHDVELHRVLCDKVFPSQAVVVRSAELGGLFEVGMTRG
jgi:nicotinamidase-related amidase